MKKKNSIFQEFVPNLYTGIFSILTPSRRSEQLRQAVKAIEQNDGFYENWQAIGNDFRSAINKFNKDMAWQSNTISKRTTSTN